MNAQIPFGLHAAKLPADVGDFQAALDAAFAAGVAYGRHAEAQRRAQPPEPLDLPRIDPALAEAVCGQRCSDGSCPRSAAASPGGGA